MARSLFVAIPLCLGLLGCQTIQLNGSECHHEGTSCDGNVLTQCERDTSYWPDRFALQERDCGDRTCVDLGGDEAFCALDDAPSPLCALQPDGPLCVDNTLIFCRDGYVLRVNECDADHTCSTAGWGACRTPAATLPDSSVPEPDAGGFDMDGGVTSTDECAGVDATLCLSVDSVGRCQGGALVDAWACPEGLFCGHVEGADACYGTPAWLPGVDCPSAGMEGFADTRQSCLDDETRITCHHGLVVDAVPCPGCHELALGGPSFDCPRLLAKPRPRHARTQREHPALGARVRREPGLVDREPHDRGCTRQRQSLCAPGRTGASLRRDRRATEVPGAQGPARRSALPECAARSPRECGGSAPSDPRHGLGADAGWQVRTRMDVIFCHGLESGPHGRKYHALIRAEPPADTMRLYAPVPTVIIHGKGDEVVPIAVSRDFAAAYPDDVRLIEVDDEHGLAQSLDRIVAETRALLAS